MRISSTQPALRPQFRPQKQKDEAELGQPKELMGGKSAAEWADILKQRSTLTGLVEPAGVIIGLVSNPLENLKTIADGGSALFQADFSSVGDAVGTMVQRSYNPEGLGGVVYNSALGLRAISGLAVGGLELYGGLKTNDKYLAMMGGADLVGAVASGARVFDLDGVALGLSVASTVAKTALVVVKPEKYSRTQKVKTMLDASGSVASSMLKSGFLVGPALAVSAVSGVGQIAYMNHSGFRGKVDGILDRIFGPEERNESARFQA